MTPLIPRPGVAPSALVTDGHSRAAVAGVRALGGAGIPVRVLAPSGLAPALWSRHAVARCLGPRSTDEAAFVARVGEIAASAGPLVVFPGQEEAVAPLVRHADALPETAVLPFPVPGPALTLSDKAAVAGLATSAGIAPPATLATGTAGELAASPPPAPCVVKSPRMSDALPVTRVCETPEQLVALLGSLPPDEPVIVQERAAGPLEALSLVLDRDGSVAARFQSRALRLMPAAAGSSSLSVSVAPDPGLVERATALLRDAGWWGLAHLQLLVTPRGHALIDVNLRFYGSLPLATAAGVNLPAAWYRVAVGEPSQPPADYRLGVRYRWLEGELMAAAKGEPRRLALPPTRRGTGAMWSSADPAASVLLAADAARLHVRGASRRLARGRRRG